MNLFPNANPMVAWLYFDNLAPRPFPLEKMLRDGSIFGAFIALHRIDGCGFMRDDRGRAYFWGPVPRIGGGR